MQMNVLKLLWDVFAASFKAAQDEASITESSYTLRDEMTVLLQQFEPTHIRQWSVTC